ncbi:MFS transporter, partial [Halobellus sp. Atlit-31R]
MGGAHLDLAADAPAQERQPAAWGSVCALALGAFALIASEFMPVSLLT